MCEICFFALDYRGQHGLGARSADQDAPAVGDPAAHDRVQQLVAVGGAADGVGKTRPASRSRTTTAGENSATLDTPSRQQGVFSNPDFS
jgi:hypothetical protein